MSNKKRSQSRPAPAKGKQRSGGPGSLVLPILVGLAIVAFVVFAIVIAERRQAPATTGVLQNTLSVPVITAQPNPTTTIPFPEIERISVKQTRELLDKDKAVLVDVRSQASYDQAHAAGAISLPEETVDTRYTELPKDKLLVLYCTWSQEQQSARAAARLIDLGVTNVKALLGGYGAWQQNGMAVESSNKP